MSSGVETYLSLLIADLLRNELLNRRVPPTTTTQPSNNSNAILDVMREYNTVIGSYNRNIEMFCGMLRCELSRNREPLPPLISVDMSGNQMDSNYWYNRATRPGPTGMTGMSDMSGVTGIANPSRLWDNIADNRNVPMLDTMDYLLFVDRDIIPNDIFTERGLTISEINATTTEIEYDEQQSILGTIQCPISLETFEDGEYLIKINYCGHIFKSRPALRWLRYNANCPVCRYNLRDGIIPNSDE